MVSPQKTKSGGSVLVPRTSTPATHQSHCYRVLAYCPTTTDGPPLPGSMTGLGATRIRKVSGECRSSANQVGGLGVLRSSSVTTRCQRAYQQIFNEFLRWLGLVGDLLCYAVSVDIKTAEYLEELYLDGIPVRDYLEEAVPEQEP